MCLISWAGAVAFRTPGALGASATVTAGAVVRVLYEEKLVVARYPEYRDDARTTKRMLPFVW